MSKVMRWIQGMDHDDSGEWVLYSDYLVLLKENEQLQKNYEKGRADMLEELRPLLEKFQGRVACGGGIEEFREDNELYYKIDKILNPRTNIYE